MPKIIRGANILGTPGGRNCGFVSFEQCMETARGTERPLGGTLARHCLWRFETAWYAMLTGLPP
jgi:ribosomal protein L34E